MEKSLENLGIGVHVLPRSVIVMGLLSGKELEVLGRLTSLPSKEEMSSFLGLAVVKEIYIECGGDVKLRKKRLVELAQKYLAHGSIQMALRAVVLAGRI